MAVRSQREGDVAVITIDRPERANAYDRSLLDALDAALPDDAAVVVIQAAGAGAFCAGADLDEMREAVPLDALELRSQRVFTRIARLPGVTIAAVHGAAVAGGMELALACDLRVAGPAARFWLPETSLGIVPSAGGITRLARLVGVALAKEIVLGGGQLDAAGAAACGLARLAEDPRAEALRWAREIAKRDAAAQRLAKELLDRGESAASLAAERVAEAVLYARKR